jgi:hypothetical protein
MKNTPHFLFALKPILVNWRGGGIGLQIGVFKAITCLDFRLITNFLSLENITD